MATLWSRDFGNYQIDKYLTVLRPLKLAGIYINESELSEVFGIV